MENFWQKIILDFSMNIIENDILKKDGTYLRCGCIYEMFEDSIYDVDLAINKVINELF